MLSFNSLNGDFSAFALGVFLIKASANFALTDSVVEIRGNKKSP